MSRTISSRRRRLAVALAVPAIALTLMTVIGAAAQPGGSPAQRIAGLHGALLETMKQGRQLGMKGRYERLEPILSETYDVPLMARIAVGQAGNRCRQPSNPGWLPPLHK